MLEAQLENAVVWMCCLSEGPDAEGLFFSAVLLPWKQWVGPSARLSSGHWECTLEGGCSAWPTPHPYFCPSVSAVK